MNFVPTQRITTCNSIPLNADGKFILYWMIANRRLDWNFSFQRALELGQDLHKPVLVFEALRVQYQWASVRLHKFILEGMKDNLAFFENSKPAGISYFPYVESSPNEQSGLLESLCKDACVLVTDDFPCFFIPAMLRLVSRSIPVKMEKVDSNGLFPMHATEQVFTTAFSFRGFLQKNLQPYMEQFPQKDPISGYKLPKAISVPDKILKRWPSADKILSANLDSFLKNLPIDQNVGGAIQKGGSVQAKSHLKVFLRENLQKYLESGNNPDEAVRSGLSPYLHFGHISSHEVFHELALQEKWNPSKLPSKGGGKREGWWQMSSNAEAFLDELITWREIGYNMCSKRPNYESYDSLPDWAKASLKKHEKDARPNLYTLEELEFSKTHDEIWNAAQNQLREEGRIHNYLRMLWGKKILEWSPSPRDALKIMIHLNNKYALDGRNPNSYSGIFWVLGRYDRPWGPERPIYGSIRYMSSDNTRKKLDLEKYLLKHGNPSSRQSELPFA
ncbi:MAG: hypothetical protein RL595_1192 [Planctomycetota bacterium]